MLRTITLSLTLAMAAAIGLPSRGGEPTCNGETNGVACGDSVCPHCGCRLVPVCHVYCTTKKVTEYKYACTCEDICIPGVTPLCKKGRSCESSGACAGDTNANGCQECCAGRCSVREARQSSEVAGDEGSAGPQMHSRVGLPALRLPRQLC